MEPKSEPKSNIFSIRVCNNSFSNHQQEGQFEHGVDWSCRRGGRDRSIFGTRHDQQFGVRCLLSVNNDMKACVVDKLMAHEKVR